MQEALEKAGAVAVVMPPQDEQGVVLRVRYHFDWQTIASISRILDKVQHSLGATVEKDPKDHCQRTDSAGILQQQRVGRTACNGKDVGTGRLGHLPLVKPYN